MIFQSGIVQECPVGTYKNVTGSDRALCFPCPSNELPHRGVYLSVRGTFMRFFPFPGP